MRWAAGRGGRLPHTRIRMHRSALPPPPFLTLSPSPSRTRTQLRVKQLEAQAAPVREVLTPVVPVVDSANRAAGLLPTPLYVARKQVSLWGRSGKLAPPLCRVGAWPGFCCARACSAPSGPAPLRPTALCLSPTQAQHVPPVEASHPRMPPSSPPRLSPPARARARAHTHTHMHTHTRTCTRTRAHAHARTHTCTQDRTQILTLTLTLTQSLYPDPNPTRSCWLPARPWRSGAA